MPVCTRGGREIETSRDYLKPEVLECRSRSQQLWPSHLSEYRYLYIIVVTKSYEKYNVIEEIYLMYYVERCGCDYDDEEYLHRRLCLLKIIN